MLVKRRAAWYNIAVMDCKHYIDLISGEYKDKFEQFKNLLLDYNNKFNLTAITDEKEVYIKHFLDSVAGESFFTQNASVVEIGSGGGFPSIPLKLVRDDLKFLLIESTGKKCGYLQTVVDKLNLKGVQVKNARAEDAAREVIHREKYDFAVARAVARLNTLCEYCIPFVKVGGKFVAYKGGAEEEIKEADNAIKILGGELEKIEQYELPNDEKRTLIIIKKVAHTPRQYPRGQGKERKAPLI
ncbi:MAG: 16S rRNA (guanine(527)-N(7))-methyltransferase RsmG [Clostridia bacterium]|nr:16S rRNA (guanine(527)-N(7))-methyltransferase RsmG [Clostridia bacterium]